MINFKITKAAEKQLSKAPKEIQEVVAVWVSSVNTIGLDATRKQGGKGLHDEPLKGKLKGKRSIRLNKSWRLYYSIKEGIVTFITIERIDKHEY